MSANEVATQTHSSCPDLIRASIKRQKGIFEERWIAGSSPAMTEGNRGRENNGNCVRALSILFVALHNSRIHNPANGQWRFGRLLCKGFGRRNKKTGKRAAGRPL